MAVEITKSRFRWLVTASLVAGLVPGVFVFYEESLLPRPLGDYMTSQYEDDLTAADIVLAVIGVPLLIVLVISVIGLYRFWSNAPALTVAVWVVGLAYQAFAGPVVELGVVASLVELSAVLTGVIIALAYTSPTSEWFAGGSEETPNQRNERR